MTESSDTGTVCYAKEPGGGGGSLRETDEDPRPGKGN